MTEKALLPSDDRTYGMERTSESEDSMAAVYMKPGLDKIDVIKIANSSVQMFRLENVKCYCLVL